MITPDTILVVAKNLTSGSIDWMQISIQVGIQTILFGIGIELLRRKYQKDLEFLKNEFTIIQTTFSNNYSIVIEFYTSFMNLYRYCQKVVNSDILEQPGSPPKRTDKIYLEHLHECVEAIRALDPKVKLIFPEKIITLYENSVLAFNNFRDTVKSYKHLSDKPKQDLIDKFKKLDEVRLDLEKELKIYLRTEKLY